MPWSKIDPKDGKNRYIKREGDNLILTREKKGHLLEELPDNAEVIVKNGRLKLIVHR